MLENAQLCRTPGLVGGTELGRNIGDSKIFGNRKKE
jgi:hypothetical protein